MKIYCVGIAILLGLAGLMHFAALIGGEAWLSALHAPPELIAAFKSGDITPYITTSAIGVALIIAAFYLTGAVGLTPRLPLTVPALVVLSLIFWARGLVLIPMMVLGFKWLIEPDAFGIGTSFVCVIIALGFTLPLLRGTKRHSNGGTL